MNSRRPASVKKESSTFTCGEKMSKLPLGPTRFSPGPILDKQEMTAEKLVAKSCPSMEAMSVPRNKNPI